MAGVIAGNDTASGYRGIAPGARLVSVKVAGADGVTSLVRVLMALDWVKRHRSDEGLKIRVLNLSLGVDAQRSYVAEPLAYAAESLWHRGVAVVAAAGNRADGTSRLDLPAADPWLIAVGASVTGSDAVADFSSRDALRPPDLVAPGTSVISMRVPGSTLDQEFSLARVGEGFFRGSGTSQAAAVVSGLAALLLEARPGLTPDQVAQVVRLSARDLGRKGFDNATGFGLLDVGAALAKKPPPRDPLEPNDDIGWVDGRAFGRAESPIFTGRRSKRLIGLLDAYEDPADVYRVRVRRRSDVRVIAKPTFGDPVLAGFSSGIKSLAKCSRRRCRSAPRLATSRRKGGRTERITLRNRTGRTRTFYVALGAQSGARALDAGYRLTIKRL
jgi:hypothetical protein